jgi:hypothetical protein
MVRKEKEREIIADSPRRRPYGGKLSLLLDRHTQFPAEGECVLLISPEVIIRMVPNNVSTEAAKQQQWDIFVEGFATAGEAEQAGLKIALGFLWVAVSGRFAARLIYSTPLPCAVYDRTQRKGGIFSGNVALTVTKSIGNIVDPVNSIISSSLPVDHKLLLATELFASARLETTERTRFIGLVSSLEPLTVQKKYEAKELAAIINSFKDYLQKSHLDDDLKASITGRIGQLKVESISKAVKRLIKETLPDNPSAVSVIEEAYILRSKILHEGTTDADLEMKSKEVEDVLRQIFEAKIKTYIP